MPRMIKKLPSDDRDNHDDRDEVPGVILLRKLGSGCVTLLCSMGEAMMYLYGPAWPLRRMSRRPPPER